MQTYERLTEKNDCNNNSHSSIHICDVELYPLHHHASMEVVIVLKGSVTIRYGYSDNLLKEGGMLVINGGDLHSIAETDEKNICCILQLDLEGYKNRHGVDGKVLCYSGCYYYRNGECTESFDALRKIIDRFTKPEIVDEPTEDALNDALIVALRNDFQNFSLEGKSYRNYNYLKGDQERTDLMNKIVKYMFDNHMYRVRLADIAAEENLSVWHLSHMFTQVMGCTFQEFLGYIRTEASEAILLGTEMAISGVAYRCGFSSAKYYTECFMNWFGMTPKEYRSRYRDVTIFNIGKKINYYSKEKGVLALREFGLRWLATKQAISNTLPGEIDLKINFANPDKEDIVIRIAEKCEISLLPIGSVLYQFDPQE